MSVANPKILFVDDDARLLRSFERLLRVKGVSWDCIFHQSPQAAIDYLACCEVDVVVSDLRMPHLSGIEMIEQMQQFCPSNMRYILLTGNGDMASAVQAINGVGIFRFLTKPCQIDDLIIAVDDALVEQKNMLSDDMSGIGALTSATLGVVTSSIFIVDAACKVIYANQCASELAGVSTGVSIDAGGVLRAEDQSFREVFYDVLANSLSGGNSATQFVSLQRRDDLQDLKVMMTSIEVERIAVVITEPENVVVPSANSLSDLFDLNHAEAVIAFTIASGGTLDDACEQCGITIQSARTYLKKIFQKTGVSRQSDLVHLVLSTPASLLRYNSHS